VLPSILLTVLFVLTIAIVTWHNPQTGIHHPGAELSRSPQGPARGVGGVRAIGTAGSGVGARPAWGARSSLEIDVTGVANGSISR
jgi:hypothetical protein